jgi:hypothetical protein
VESYVTQVKQPKKKLLTNSNTITHTSMLNSMRLSLKNMIKKGVLDKRLMNPKHLTMILVTIVDLKKEQSMFIMMKM